MRIYHTDIQNHWQLLVFCGATLCVYPLYKSLYWIPIRNILSYLNWIPQLSWHKKQVETLSFTVPKDKKYYSSFVVCSTCINSCINMIKGEEKMLKSVEFQNTVAHILYMSSFISLCLLLLNMLQLLDVSWLIRQNYQYDLIIAISGLLTGVIYDRSVADLRELSLLKKYRKNYLQILKNLIEK